MRHARRAVQHVDRKDRWKNLKSKKAGKTDRKQKAREKEPSKKTTGKSALRENVEAILVAVVLALFIRAFVVQAFKIPSGSMKETLQIGDHILVNKFIYGIRLPFTNQSIIPVSRPERGDIVVFRFPMDPAKDFIKRVVGVAGDKIHIRDKKVYINGEEQNHEYAVFKDPHVLPTPRDNLGPRTVPENAVFVMGDNRDNSNDGRFWGFVDQKHWRGKAFIIYWSWDNEDDHFGVRWSRIGKLVR
ncbi:MAG: signal peptidase I [Desulfobacterales bacterium]|nr:signal peptidase I [Desulfobacterales bacterium]